MSLKKLIKNIKLLSRTDLSKFVQEQIDVPQLYDNLMYEIFDSIKTGNIKSVCGIMDSLNYLVKSGCSMIRFGDGEISLIDGKGIPFQSASPILATRLKQALSANNKNLIVGIPSVLYKEKSHMEPYARDFWRNNGSKYRGILEEYIDFGRNTYYAAEMTLGFADPSIDKKV